MLIPDVSHCRAPVRGGNTSRDAGTMRWCRQRANRRLAFPEDTNAVHHDGALKDIACG